MSQLKVYNTLTRQKEVFTTLVPGYAGMYVCGPTVSGESHLGHARPYITFDIVFRYLMHLGYRVRYVRNVTDAGHFEEEGREAEDKISKKALIEKLEPMELVHKYTNLFHWAMLQFNNVIPNIEPTATGHIVEQIEMIEKIIELGYAYVKNGSVYFNVEKYNTDYTPHGNPYGILSGRSLEGLLENTRELENQDEKTNGADFALWKNAPPEHIMRWKSPWGYGFPGWHIECSAMSSKYLGEEFDIHGGGMDLQFPHHECEIAQSVVVNNKMPARYWLHNNMITINGRKMGKSYNNVIRLTEMFSGGHPLLQQAYTPMTIRFFILQSHYRSTLDFSNEALQASQKAYKRLWDAYEFLMQLKVDSYDMQKHDNALQDRVHNLLNELEEFMNDDFNTAKVLANLFELVPVINGIKDKHIASDAITREELNFWQQKMKTYVEDILGLKAESNVDEAKLKGSLQLLIDIRKQAKANKDFVISDKIRSELCNLGILLKDEKDGNMTYTY